MKFEGLFMFHLHTKFHVPSSNDSRIITIKPKAKYNGIRAVLSRLITDYRNIS
jgi:hypothetical protein